MSVVSPPGVNGVLATLPRTKSSARPGARRSDDDDEPAVGSPSSATTCVHRGGSQGSQSAPGNTGSTVTVAGVDGSTLSQSEYSHSHMHPALQQPRALTLVALCLTSIEMHGRQRAGESPDVPAPVRPSTYEGSAKRDSWPPCSEMHTTLLSLSRTFPCHHLGIEKRQLRLHV